MRRNRGGLELTVFVVRESRARAHLRVTMKAARECRHGVTAPEAIPHDRPAMREPPIIGTVSLSSAKCTGALNENGMHAIYHVSETNGETCYRLEDSNEFCKEDGKSCVDHWAGAC